MRGWLVVLMVMAALRLSAAPETNRLDWWSFKLAIQPPVPAADTQARNEVDQFIVAKRAENKLPSPPEEERRTLLRRVTFNLTGRLPNLEEMGAFLADTSADASEKVVEHLLASPRYGESDEWSYKAAKDVTTCYDLHATVLHQLGINHEKQTFRHNGIDRCLTDVHGEVIRDIPASFQFSKPVGIFRSAWLCFLARAISEIGIIAKTPRRRGAKNRRKN